MERVIAARLSSHLFLHNLMSKVPSAYRKFYSSETVLLYIQIDILASLDIGHSTVLLLLDLSAAFGTIDHSILTHCSQHWFSISFTSSKFIILFLSDRSQTVKTPMHQSINLFNWNIVFLKIVCRDPYSIHYTRLHFIPLYQNVLAFVAISIQTTLKYPSFSPELASFAFSSIESSIKNIFSWMIGNKLSVNLDKTEYLLFNSKMSMFLLALILN